MEEEADSAKANTTKSNPKKTTSTTNKTLQMLEAEHPEGGTMLLDQAIVIVRSNVDFVENMITTKRSVKRRNETWPRPADNS